MNDQTKCPHCGADLKCRWAGKDMYDCATIVESGVTLCRDVVCLTRELEKEKELLKEAAEAITKTVQIIQQYDEWQREDFHSLIEMNHKLTTGY